jgi:hypothetical protein
MTREDPLLINAHIILFSFKNRFTDKNELSIAFVGLGECCLWLCEEVGKLDK